MRDLISKLRQMLEDSPSSILRSIPKVKLAGLPRMKIRAVAGERPTFAVGGRGVSITTLRKMVLQAERHRKAVERRKEENEKRKQKERKKKKHRRS